MGPEHRNGQWDLSGENRKLQLKMERATNAVVDKQREINNSLDELEMERRKVSKKDELADDRLEPIDLRTAAFVLAIGRVAQGGHGARYLAVEPAV